VLYLTLHGVEKYNRIVPYLQDLKPKNKAARFAMSLPCLIEIPLQGVLCPTTKRKIKNEEIFKQDLGSLNSFKAQQSMFELIKLLIFTNQIFYRGGEQFD
jgi:hypothetical protein